MSKNKLGSERAFACVDSQKQYLQEGVSKRFYAACAAMQGIMAGRKISFDAMSPSRVVEFSYKLADELLKEEND